MGQQQYSVTVDDSGNVSSTSSEVIGPPAEKKQFIEPPTSSTNSNSSDQQGSDGSAVDFAARRSLLLVRKKKKHVCHVCQRECPSKHKLKRHLSTHSEERPFVCGLCGKSFKWTEYLHKHLRQQHAGSSGGEGELCDVVCLLFSYVKYYSLHELLGHLFIMVFIVANG